MRRRRRRKIMRRRMCSCTCHGERSIAPPPTDTHTPPHDVAELDSSRYGQPDIAHHSTGCHAILLD